MEQTSGAEYAFMGFLQLYNSKKTSMSPVTWRWQRQSPDVYQQWLADV
jgi:hypothetical protein